MKRPLSMLAAIVLTGCASAPDPSRPGQALESDDGILACVIGVALMVAAELVAPGGAIDLSSGIGHCDSAAYIPSPDDLEEDTR